MALKLGGLHGGLQVGIQVVFIKNIMALLIKLSHSISRKSICKLVTTWERQKGQKEKMKLGF